MRMALGHWSGLLATAFEIATRVFLKRKAGLSGGRLDVPYLKRCIRWRFIVTDAVDTRSIEPEGLLTASS